MRKYVFLAVLIVAVLVSSLYRPTRAGTFTFGAVATGMVPFRTNDYINYMGVNEHVSSSAPTSDVQTLAMAAVLPYLHITKLRININGGFGSTTNIANVFNYLVSNGGVLTADCQTNETDTYTTITGTYDPALTGGCGEIEQANEPSKATPNPATFASQAASWRSNLGAGRLIWGPSFVVDGNPGNVEQWTQLNTTIGSNISAWTSHPYSGQGGGGANRAYQPEFPGNGTTLYGCGFGPNFAVNPCAFGGPGTTGSLPAMLAENQTLAPNLYGVSTEGIASYGSYHNKCDYTSPTSAPNPHHVDMPTQQAYVQRGFLYGFSLGLRRAYMYQMLDQPGSQPTTYPQPCNDGYGDYGLMNVITNGSGGDGFGTVLSANPKPALTALANMNSLLFDTGGSASTFAVTPLNITITAGSDVSSYLFEQSNGTYWLALTSVSQLWNPATPGDDSLVSDTVTLTLNSGSATWTAYTQDSTGITGAWTKNATTTSTNTITLSGASAINQFPTLVEIIPSNVVATPEPLPTYIPTPGATETP